MGVELWDGSDRRGACDGSDLDFFGRLQFLNQEKIRLDNHPENNITQPWNLSGKNYVALEQVQFNTLTLHLNSVYDVPIQLLDAKRPTPITSLSEVEFG